MNNARDGAQLVAGNIAAEEFSVRRADQGPHRGLVVHKDASAKWTFRD